MLISSRKQKVVSTVAAQTQNAEGTMSHFNCIEQWDWLTPKGTSLSTNYVQLRFTNYFRPMFVFCYIRWLYGVAIELDIIPVRSTICSHYNSKILHWPKQLANVKLMISHICFSQKFWEPIINLFLKWTFQSDMLSFPDKHACSFMSYFRIVHSNFDAIRDIAFVHNIFFLKTHIKIRLNEIRICLVMWHENENSSSLIEN